MQCLHKALIPDTPGVAAALATALPQEAVATAVLHLGTGKAMVDKDTVDKVTAERHTRRRLLGATVSLSMVRG